MLNDLDHILLDQLHCARKRLANIRRMKRTFHDPVNLDLVEESTRKYIQFLESMIQDKSLIKKRRRKRLARAADVLERNPIVTYYRNLWIFLTFTYGMLFNWYKKER